MKNAFTLIIFILSLNWASGQQDKQLTHYTFDKMSFNPATTGFKGLCGTYIYRNQWDRVQDAPNTSLINVQANIPRRNLGVGLSFTNDAIGYQRNNTLTVNSAYHLRTSVGVLSAGLGIGFLNVGFSPTWVPPQTPDDPLLPIATEGTALDANLGLYWHGTAPYYVGISTTHIATPSLKKINYSVARHYYLIAGYNYNLNLPSRSVKLKPSTLIKADGASVIFDVNLMADVWINDFSYLWGGVTYRMSDAVALCVGYAFSPSEIVTDNMFKIGYSFDIMTNPLNPYGRGTHELMISFCLFPKLKGIGRHGNPFFLD
jgi:type IX secretion system PorP/SprF family membrane protein